MGSSLSLKCYGVFLILWRRSCHVTLPYTEVTVFQCMDKERWRKMDGEDRMCVRERGGGGRWLHCVTVYSNIICLRCLVKCCIVLRYCALRGIASRCIDLVVYCIAWRRVALYIAVYCTGWRRGMLVVYCVEWRRGWRCGALQTI